MTKVLLCLWYPRETRMGHTYLLWSEVWCLSKGKSTCAIICVENWNNHAFNGIHFYWNVQLWNKLWLFRLKHLADIFLILNKISMLPKRKQLLVFLTNDTIWVFKQKQNFENYDSITISSRASQYFKNIFDEITYWWY